MRCLFVLALCSLAARLAAADSEWTRTMDATVESKFVRRGIERAGASVRPAVWATDATWELGAWANLPFEQASRTELGVSAGYTRTFGADVKFGVEIAQFRFGGAEAGHPKHTTELGATLSFSAGPGRVALDVTRDGERRADIGQLSYAGEYALKNWGAFLNYRVYLGSVDAADVLPRLVSPLRVADSYTYHGVDLTLPYRVGGQTIVTAGVHYAGTNGARPFWSPDGASTRAKLWLSLAASYEF